MEVLRQGDTVVADGLRDTSDLNGVQGTFVGWEGEGEREKGLVDYEGIGVREVGRDLLVKVKPSMRHLSGVVAVVGVAAAAVYFEMLNNVLLRLKPGDGVKVTRLIQRTPSQIIFSGSLGYITKVPGETSRTVGVMVNGVYLDATSADVVPFSDAANPLIDQGWDRCPPPSRASRGPQGQGHPKPAPKGKLPKKKAKPSWFCCFAPSVAPDDSDSESRSHALNRPHSSLPRVSTSSASSTPPVHPVAKPPHLLPAKSPPRPIDTRTPRSVPVKSPPQSAFDTHSQTSIKSPLTFDTAKSPPLSLPAKSPPQSPLATHSQTSIKSPTAPDASNRSVSFTPSPVHSPPQPVGWVKTPNQVALEAAPPPEGICTPAMLDEQTGVERRQTLPVGSLGTIPSIRPMDVDALYELLLKDDSKLTYTKVTASCNDPAVQVELHHLGVVENPFHTEQALSDIDRLLEHLQRADGIIVTPAVLQEAVIAAAHHTGLPFEKDAISQRSSLHDVVEVSTESTQQPGWAKAKKEKKKKHKKSKKSKKEKKERDISPDPSDDKLRPATPGASQVSASSVSSLKPCEVMSSPVEGLAEEKVLLPAPAWGTASPQEETASPSPEASPEATASLSLREVSLSPQECASSPLGFKQSPQAGVPIVIPPSSPTLQEHKLVLSVEVNREEGEPLGLDITDDMVVSKVVPEGPAARAGLSHRCVGMQLFSVDGHPVETPLAASQTAGKRCVALQFCLPDESKLQDVMSSPQVDAPPCTPITMSPPTRLCVPCEDVDGAPGFMSPLNRHNERGSLTPGRTRNHGLMGQNRIRWVRTPIQADAAWVDSLRTR